MRIIRVIIAVPWNLFLVILMMTWPFVYYLNCLVTAYYFFKMILYWGTPDVYAALACALSFSLQIFLQLAIIKGFIPFKAKATNT